MPIDATNIIPEFSQSDMRAFIERQVDLSGLVYRNFFPTQFIPSMDWGNMESDRNPFVMADVVAWGSRAPRKGREFIESIRGELPKIEVARDKTERDLYTLQQLRQAVALNRGNEGVANQFVRSIYDDTLFTINSINARLEGIAQSLVSTGKYTTKLATNSMGVHEVEFDFGISSGGVTKTWSTLTDSDDPLQDIRDLQETATAAGHPYRYAFIQRSTLNRLLKNKNVAAFATKTVYVSGAAYPLATLEALNDSLSSEGLPTFVIWEAFIQHEAKDGTRTRPTMWTDGNIMFSTTLELGATQYTTTEEYNINFGSTIAKSITDGMILTTMYGSQDPVMVSTKSVAFALPILDNTRSCFILKTQTAK